MHDLQISPNFASTYYAVFDGHGGAECSRFLRTNFHIFLRRELLGKFEGTKLSDGNEYVGPIVEKSLREACRAAD